MSLNVIFNGSNFIIPETGEVGWGGNTTSYLVAIAAGALQKTGGSFTLSAETDFGASFGLMSLYYKSRNSNPAASGILRLNNNSDAISWRNAANSGDLPLLVNASNELLFNGNQVLTGTGPSSYVASITGTANQVIASAATGAVTLSLPQSINTGASVQFGTLAIGSTLTTSAILSLASTTLGFLPPRMTTVQRDAIATPATGLLIYNTTTNQYDSYNGSAWVALAMSGGGTVNAGTQYQLGYYAVNGTTISGLPLITASRALESDVNGLPIASNVTTTELSYLSGVTSAVQTQLNSKLNLTGGTLTGALTIVDGTDAIPGIRFTTEPTGFFLNSTTNPHLTLNGVDNYLWNTAQFSTTTAFTQARNLGSLTAEWGTLFAVTGTFSGNMSATDGTFSGDVSATNGIFTGDISAIDGTFTGPLLVTDSTTNAIRAQASVNGINPRITARNTNATAGQDRAALIGAAGDGGTVELSLIAGKDTSNANIEILSGTTKVDIGVGGVSYATVRSTGVSILGTTTNDNAATGYVGQYISSVLPQGSAVSLTSTQYNDATSITLSAGDWDISAFPSFVGTPTGGVVLFGGIGTTAGNSAVGLIVGDNAAQTSAMPTTSVSDINLAIPPYRVSLTSSTTYYLKIYGGFSGGTLAGYGRISARRVR